MQEKRLQALLVEVAQAVVQDHPLSADRLFVQVLGSYEGPEGGTEKASTYRYLCERSNSAFITWESSEMPLGVG